MTESYHGTRGHSGGDASRDAAIAERDKGKTSEMMGRVLRLIYMRGGRGATSAELRFALPDEHHGRITSALTKLHIAGEVSALRERRGNCGVYVAAGWENGREVRPYRRQNVKLRVEDVEDVLERHRLGLSSYCSCGMSLSLEPAMHRAHVAGLIVALSRGDG